MTAIIQNEEYSVLSCTMQRRFELTIKMAKGEQEFSPKMQQEGVQEKSSLNTP